MKLGIVGLPNIGKSALFNSITKAGALAANYPFKTVDPNIGMVPVPDKRLDFLTKLYNSPKTIPATIEFVDIAGLVKGSGKGEGLGNKFLSHIREVDAIVHVVRLFDDPNVVHVDGSINPIRDIETINLELIFSDLEIIEKRILKTEKALKSDKSLARELELLNDLKENLFSGKNARQLEYSDDDAAFVDSLTLISRKPVIYAANVSENELMDNSNSHYADIESMARLEKSDIFPVCAKLEEEISQFSDEERLQFLNELGVSSTSLERLITASYSVLGLISFLTAGPKETRAWTIKKGLKAPQAARKIHSDLERGFIRAEIVSYDDLYRCGNYNAAKEAGVVRLEGKEYVVKDGDVILFRFNV